MDSRETQGGFPARIRFVTTVRHREPVSHSARGAVRSGLSSSTKIGVAPLRVPWAKESAGPEQQKSRATRARNRTKFPDDEANRSERLEVAIRAPDAALFRCNLPREVVQ